MGARDSRFEDSLGFVRGLAKQKIDCGEPLLAQPGSEVAQR